MENSLPARLDRFTSGSDSAGVEPVLDRLLNLREVKILTSLSKTSIYRFVRAGSFPQPYSIATNRVAWSAHEIAAWRRARRAMPRRTAPQLAGAA